VLLNCCFTCLCECGSTARLKPREFINLTDSCVIKVVFLKLRIDRNMLIH